MAAIRPASSDNVQGLRVNGEKQILLSLDVMIKRGLGDPQLVSQIVQGGAAVAPLAKEFHSGVDDLLMSQALVEFSKRFLGHIPLSQTAIDTNPVL